MKVVSIFFIMALFVLPLMAEQTQFYPTAPQNNSWFDLTFTGPADAEQSFSGTVEKLEGIIDQAEIAPPSGNSYEGMDIGSGGSSPLWGNDILVMSHGNPTFGKLSTDYDENTGDIYVSLLVPHSGVDDTVYTYRSTDGGGTWEQFTMQYGNSSTGGIADHQILLGYDGSGTWIYSFCLYDGSGSSGGIWVLRMRPDSTGIQWTQIVVAGDTISKISVDRNIENPQHIFLGFSTTANNIRLGSSSDYTSSWGNWRYVSSNGKDVSVAAGGDGYVYIAYARDTTDIQIGRYTNNLINPSYVFTVLNEEDEGDWTPSVGAARTSPGTSQAAWILWRHRHTGGNADIHSAYSQDGGATWTFTPWPPTNSSHTTWDMKHPYARFSYGNSLLRGIATVPETGDDSLVYAYSTSTDPTSWSGRGVNNDYGITGEFGGRVDYSPDCLGGYIVYREFASPNIWFDGYSVGVTETPNVESQTFVKIAPNPSSNRMNLRFATRSNGNVKIAVYDVSGKLVSTIVDSQKKAGTHNAFVNTNLLSSGTYFIKVNSPDGTFTKRFTVVK